MELQTIDSKKAVTLDADVFSEEFNSGLVHQTVVAFINNARAGNSAQKTRSEVRGGGRKPWKQKGTGRARAGTIRSPIWRSGGVTFASKKRDYSQKLNKKMYKKAMRGIFSELLRKDCISIVDTFHCETKKTKEFISKLQDFNLNNALVVVNDVGENEYFASRNVHSYDVCDVKSLDPVQILKYDSLLFTTEAVKQLEGQLK